MNDNSYYADLVYVDVSFCIMGASAVYFADSEYNEFYFRQFTFLDGNYNNCTISGNNTYQYNLFDKFWNNYDLLVDLGDEFPFHFTYSIQQHENHQSLIVINDAGYEAHYQSVPYMSVNQNEFSNLNIYPNPVQESFQTENLTEQSNLKIYDISGKEIFNQSIHSSAESVDVSQLSSGLYFYGIFQEGRRVKTGKLVKE